MKPVICIGVIMDGNRRFARARGLPTLEGHRRGYEKLKELMGWAKEAGIKDVVVFGFSTENWNRSADEVGYLMDLIKRMLVVDAEEFRKEGGRLRIVGQRERFSPDLQKAFADAEELTKDGDHTLWLAVSYGGRAEILSAVNRLVKGGREIDEQGFSDALWTSGMPDPDIIVRTSGEQRLSGFLPWQGVYSELFFVPGHWPDFSKKDFQNILDEYQRRDRRHGK